jgi:hypothetical protein
MYPSSMVIHKSAADVTLLETIGDGHHKLQMHRRGAASSIDPNSNHHKSAKLRAA